MEYYSEHFDRVIDARDYAVKCMADEHLTEDHLIPSVVSINGKYAPQWYLHDGCVKGIDIHIDACRHDPFFGVDSDDLARGVSRAKFRVRISSESYPSIDIHRKENTLVNCINFIRQHLKEFKGDLDKLSNKVGWMLGPE